MTRPMTVFEISGRAMSAQLLRMNTTASNLANAGTIAGSPETAFRALRPVFSVVQAGTAPSRRHDPNHPLADANGDVWEAGVDTAAELIDMVETARQYQNNVQVLQTAKTLTLDTLRLGQ